MWSFFVLSVSILNLDEKHLLSTTLSPGRRQQQDRLQFSWTPQILLLLLQHHLPKLKTSSISRRIKVELYLSWKNFFVFFLRLLIAQLSPCCCNSKWLTPLFHPFAKGPKKPLWLNLSHDLPSKFWLCHRDLKIFSMTEPIPVIYVSYKNI